MNIELKQKKAVILLSGGLDSATTSYIAKEDGYSLYALSFEYGQRHNVELEMAKKIAADVGVVEHKVAKIDLRIFGGSALTDDIKVPKNRDLSKDEIPVTYVPARNTIFLSFALAYSEVIGANDIFIGANVIDYSGYPDCRPEFLEAFENMANLATAYAIKGQRIKIRYPLLSLAKGEIIAKGLSMGVNYQHTISCYDPDIAGNACGQCDACLLRLEGFKANAIKDPAKYKIRNS